MTSAHFVVNAVKSLSWVFEINELAVNCPQVTDKYGAYTYPCLPAGLSAAKWRFSHKNRHTLHTNHTQWATAEDVRLSKNTPTNPPWRGGEVRATQIPLPHEGCFSGLGRDGIGRGTQRRVIRLETKSNRGKGKSGIELAASFPRKSKDPSRQKKSGWGARLGWGARQVRSQASSQFPEKVKRPTQAKETWVGHPAGRSPLGMTKIKAQSARLKVVP